MIQAVYDVLPSQVNLHIWGKSNSPSCPRCLDSGSLEHMLSSCPTTLGEGRYRWWHDQVLNTIAETIFRAINTPVLSNTAGPSHSQLCNWIEANSSSFLELKGYFKKRREAGSILESSSDLNAGIPPSGGQNHMQSHSQLT